MSLADASAGPPDLVTKSDPKPEILRRALRASSLTIFLFFGVLGGWFHFSRLDSAAIATGYVVAGGTTRNIQHLEGGIVREIFVRNGDVVEADDLLLRLDPTRSAASADLFRTQLWIARARQARLEAEIALAEEFAFPQDVQEMAGTMPSLARAMEEERAQFTLARSRLSKQEELLKSQIEQSALERAGHAQRIEIANAELELVRQDLANTEQLRTSGLINQASVTALRRDELDLLGRVAQAEVEIARLGQGIAGLELQIEQAREDHRQRAADQLDITMRDIRAFERDAIIADDSLERVELRAPVTGTVQESILGTIGAVIRPGETILRVAPLEDEFLIMAQFSPNDIDNILPGSTAEIRFPAFQSLDLRPAQGHLRAISRDRITDERTGSDFFEATVELDPESLPDHLRERMVAGMAAQVILPTGERSALSYLLGPLLNRLQTAMRED